MCNPFCLLLWLLFVSWILGGPSVWPRISGRLKMFEGQRQKNKKGHQLCAKGRRCAERALEEHPRGHFIIFCPPFPLRLFSTCEHHLSPPMLWTPAKRMQMWSEWSDLKCIPDASCRCYLYFELSICVWITHDTLIPGLNSLAETVQDDLRCLSAL